VAQLLSHIENPLKELDKDVIYIRKVGVKAETNLIRRLSN